MTGSEQPGTERTRLDPKMGDDGTITLYGVGPDCPGGGGPTYAVTGDEEADRPWWCKDCNVRLDDGGEPGSQADFPAGSEPAGDRDE